MILKIFITIICFFGGAIFGFFIYSFVIAYLIEQNLPNKEIAVGLLETTKMIFLIGSLRMGELEEYVAPTITIISFASLFSIFPIWFLKSKKPA
jgi:hypothetical protein